MEEIFGVKKTLHKLVKITQQGFLRQLKKTKPTD